MPMIVRSSILERYTDVVPLEFTDPWTSTLSKIPPSERWRITGMRVTMSSTEVATIAAIADEESAKHILGNPSDESAMLVMCQATARWLRDQPIPDGHSVVYQTPPAEMAFGEDDMSL